MALFLENFQGLDRVQRFGDSTVVARTIPVLLGLKPGVDFGETDFGVDGGVSEPVTGSTVNLTTIRAVPFAGALLRNCRSPNRLGRFHSANSANKTIVLMRSDICL
jgi:hypothetical protein